VHSGLPAKLSAWLSVKTSKGFLSRDVQHIHLALGPNNNSYFVTDGKDYQWWNLPPGLNTAIEKLRKPGGGFTFAPRLVCLGVNNSYVMATAGNGGSWNVADGYPDLDNEISAFQKAHGNKPGMFSGINVRTVLLSSPPLNLPYFQMRTGTQWKTRPN
jgi:hypothetical protein